MYSNPHPAKMEKRCIAGSIRVLIILEILDIFKKVDAVELLDHREGAGMDVFYVITPVMYLVLALIWFFILLFCIVRLKQGRLRGQIFFIILIIFAIEAFRTLFESLYFGVMSSSRFGILPNGLFTLLSQPGLVSIPKILNVLAAVLILVLLLRYWIPNENRFLTEQQARLREFEENQELKKRTGERLRVEQTLRESEQSMGAILKAAPIGITICQPDGRFVMVSDDFQKVMGYDEKELQSLRFVDITHPEDRPDTEAAAARVVAGEMDHYELDKRYVKKDGNVLWGRLRAAAVRDSEGTLRQWIGLIEDITEKKKYQEQMARLVQAIESTGDGIGITDQDGNAVYLNRAMKELIGYDVEELNSAGGPPIIYTDKKKAEEALVSSFSGTAWKGEMELTAQNGRVTPVESDAAPIFSEDGQVIGVIGVHRDISERKLTEKNVARPTVVHSTDSEPQSHFYLRPRSGGTPQLVYERSGR